MLAAPKPEPLEDEEGEPTTQPPQQPQGPAPPAPLPRRPSVTGARRLSNSQVEPPNGLAPLAPPRRPSGAGARRLSNSQVEPPNGSDAAAPPPAEPAEPGDEAPPQGPHTPHSVAAHRENAAHRGAVKTHTQKDLELALKEYGLRIWERWHPPQAMVVRLLTTIREGKFAIFDHQGRLCMVTEALTIQLRAGKEKTAPVLVQTHKRAKYSAAHVAGAPPVCLRNMLRAQSEVVQLWLSGLLDVEYTALNRKFYVAWTKVEPLQLTPSQTYPGLFDAVRPVMVEVHLVEAVSVLAPWLQDGRPIVSEQSPLAEEGKIWSWWPSCTRVLRPPGGKADFSKTWPAYAPFDSASRLLRDALNTEDLVPEIQAVLRLHGGSAAALVVLANPPPSSDPQPRDPLPFVVLQVDMNVSTDEVAEKEKLLKKFQEPGFATSPVPPKVSLARMAAWRFELRGGCWEVQDVMAVAKRMPVVCLLEDVVRVACGRCADLAEIGKKAACIGLTLDLAPRLPRLLAQFAGVGGILDHFASTVERATPDILELTPPQRLILNYGTGQGVHSVFNIHTKLLIRRLCTAAGEAEVEAEDAASRVSGALEVLAAACETLRVSRKWRPELWRPLICTAHGNVNCTTAMVDLFGSAWICGPPTAKSKKPVFWDVASLAVSMLVECCWLPVSIPQLWMVAAEPWITSEDIVRWFLLPPSAAQALLDALREEKLELRDPAEEFEEDDGGAGQEAAAAAEAKRLKSFFPRLLNSVVLVAPASVTDSIIETLKSGMVITQEAADAEMRSATELAELWVEHLDVQGTFPEEPPARLTGNKRDAWRAQQALFRSAADSYRFALHSFRQRTSAKLLLADTSFLLLALPALQHVLPMLNDPAIPPWQKVWISKLATMLSGRICREVAAMEAKEETPIMPPAPVPARLRVRYAPGHRWFLWREPGEEEEEAAALAEPASPTVSAAPTVAMSEARSAMAIDEEAVDFYLPPTPTPSSGIRRLTSRASVAKFSEEDDGMGGLGEVHTVTVRTGGELSALLEVELSGSSGPGALLLTSWPAPLTGIGAAQLWHMREHFGRPHHSIFDIEEKRHIDTLVHEARVAHFKNNEAAALYEVVGVAVRKRQSDPGSFEVAADLALEHEGPGLILAEGLQIGTLSAQGRQIGLVGLGEHRVKACPMGGPQHEAVGRMKLREAYSRFPCSICRTVIQGQAEMAKEADSDGEEEGAEPHQEEPELFGHCAECWRERRRFDVCAPCVEECIPFCIRGHEMQALQDSPYERRPICKACKAEIPSLPPWQFPPVLPEQTVAGPHFFHCGTCKARGLPASDLCTRCAVRRCPVGHSLPAPELLTNDEAAADSDLEETAGDGGDGGAASGGEEPSETAAAAATTCRYCGEAGGVLFVSQCLICQEGRCEVSYPSKEALQADIGIAGSRRASLGLAGGAQVLTAAPGGPASIAGVRSGHRLLTLNGQKVVGPFAKMLAAVPAGPCSAAFCGEVAEVLYNTAAALHEDITFTWRGGALVVRKVTSGGSAARAGVSRGSRLMIVNTKTVEELGWDGVASLESIMPSTTVLFHLQLRKRSCEFYFHAGCGIPCDKGHLMEPQFPGFLACQVGHFMRCTSLAEAMPGDFPRQCGECHEELVFAENHELRFLTCRECHPKTCDFGTADPGVVRAVSESRLSMSMEAGCARTPSPLPKTVVARRRRSTAESAELARLTRSKMKVRRMAFCWSCACKLNAARRSAPPYQNEGTVECTACNKVGLGRPPRQRALENGGEAVAWSLTGAEAERDSTFYHCAECWDSRGIQSDFCKPCSRSFLRCTPRGHALPLVTVSPYVSYVDCVVCERRMHKNEAAYHCADCWLCAGTRADRCDTCAQQTIIKYTVDEDARFQVFSGEVPRGPQGGLEWCNPLEVQAQLAVGPLEGSRPPLEGGSEAEHPPFTLGAELRLRGFVYPAGARVRIAPNTGTATGVDEPREATICNLLPNGAYEILVDGETESTPFEPIFGNHLPAGVFRYMPGQELSVFIGEEGWRDVRVVTVDDRGTRHLVEELEKPSTAAKAHSWMLDLSTCNHTPLLLPSHEWLVEQRSWETQTLLDGSSVDVLTGQKCDILEQLWSVHDAEGTAPLSRDQGGDEPENRLPWLLEFTESSRRRHEGIHRANGALVVGEPASGKSMLLRRLAVECVRAHCAEIVPIFIDPAKLEQSLDPDGPFQQRLRFGEFLDEYLAATHKEGSAVLNFLRQAMHARRALLLVDGLELASAEVRAPLLRGLGRLVTAGHRVVVTMRSTCEGIASLSVPELRGLRLAPLSPGQRRWQAERRLAADQAAIFLERLASFEAGLTSSAPMFEFLLRVAEVKAARLASRLAARQRAESPQRGLNRRGGSRMISPRGPMQMQLQLGDSGRSHRASEVVRTPNSMSPRMLFPHGATSRSPSPKLLETVPVQEEPAFKLPPLISGYLEAAIQMVLLRTFPKTRATAAAAAAAARERAEREAAAELTAAASTPTSRSPRAARDSMLPRMRSKDRAAAEEEEDKSGGEEERIATAHAWKVLTRVAFFMQNAGREDFQERDVRELCSSPHELLQAWKALQAMVDSGKVFLLGCCRARAYKGHGQVVLMYRFAHPHIQRYLAACEVHSLWGTPQCRIREVEDMVREAAWRPMLPFFAEQVKTPLTLRFKSISEAEVKAVAALLSTSQAVARLSCEGAGIGQRLPLCRTLSSALAANKALVLLDLAENGLGSEGAETLCLALAPHPRLEELILRGNHVGRIGAGFVADLLRANRSITALDLSKNSIGDEGLALLLPGLQSNPVVQSVNLQGNNLGTDSSRHSLLRLMREDCEVKRTVDTKYNRRGFPERFCTEEQPTVELEALATSGLVSRPASARSPRGGRGSPSLQEAAGSRLSAAYP